MDFGSYVVRCVKPGGDTLTLYNFAATQGQEVDLLDSGLYLRAPVAKGGVSCRG